MRAPTIDQATEATTPTVTITDPTTYLNSSDPNNYVVTATTPDGDVTHVDFFECSNSSTGCSTGSWNQFGTDNSAPYAATWSTPAFDGPKAIRAVAVDAASNASQDIRFTVETSTVWWIIGIAVIVIVVLVLWGVFRRYGRR